MAEHGTRSRYANQRCRCEDCREAHAVAQRLYRRREIPVDPAMRDLLNELFPFGLTNDCPLGRKILDLDCPARRGREMVA